MQIIERPRLLENIQIKSESKVCCRNTASDIIRDVHIEGNKIQEIQDIEMRENKIAARSTT